MHYHPIIQHKKYTIMSQECQEIFCKLVQITFM